MYFLINKYRFLFFASLLIIVAGCVSTEKLTLPNPSINPFSYNYATNSRTPSKVKFRENTTSKNKFTSCFSRNWEIQEQCLVQKPEPCIDSNSIKCVISTDGKIFPVSILSIDELHQIYTELNNMPTEFYEYAQNGCGPRALFISAKYLFNENKVFMMNLMLDGEFNPKDFPGFNWVMHVAPFVFINDNGQRKRAIIDPLLLKDDFHKASFEHWIERMNPAGDFSERIWGPLYTPNQKEISKAHKIGNFAENKKIFNSNSFLSLADDVKQDALELLYSLALNQ